MTNFIELNSIGADSDIRITAEDGAELFRCTSEGKLIIGVEVHPREVAEAIRREFDGLTDQTKEIQALKELLQEAVMQLRYLDERSPSGTTPNVINKIEQALATNKEGK